MPHNKNGGVDVVSRAVLEWQAGKYFLTWQSLLKRRRDNGGYNQYAKTDKDGPIKNACI